MARLLWIGDDRRLVDMTARLLRRRGYEVVPVVGVDEARRALEAGRVELVISDSKADTDTCDRILRMVRESSPSPKLLWISSDASDEVPILNAGANDWMKSPYSIDVLTARVAALLRGSSG